MNTAITPGRWRGLVTTSSAAQMFTIMAFDQRGTYVKMLPDNFSYQDAVTIKQEVVTALSPYTSAVLLDVTYGLPAAFRMDRGCGLLMALEKSGYTGTSTYRQVDFDPDWTVEKIKKMGASAVKLLVYYHPDAGALAEEIENVVRDVTATCHAHDLPLFVEPVSYSLDTTVSKSSADFARQRPAVVRETARRFSQLGADVLKLEFPVDADFDDDTDHWQAACDALSAVCTVPWALLSAGVDFQVFERQVETACRSGASGFLCGRAIWKECIAMTAGHRQQFLSTTGTDRVKRLSELADRLGRPWTDYYQPIAVTEDWYTTYA